MAEELKELIEKIQRDGVKAGEDKAKEIEASAGKRAEEIVKNAEMEAARMLADAKEEIKTLEEGSKKSIKQVARDTMLSLRAEISAMLEQLVRAHLHKALAPGDLAKILASAIKSCGSHKEQIVVSLRKEDLEKVEKELFSELGQEAKKGITLMATSDIRGGFLISYDSGKSYFDFSDKALAEYLASQLKTGLAEIMKEAGNT
ncbi:MAG: hypothetical protein JXB40_03040 [Candidatus Omnitrophica bacterium]|nr:hypothetical protein [Candidatus Omnitrophota bacterium]